MRGLRLAVFLFLVVMVSGAVAGYESEIGGSDKIDVDFTYSPSTPATDETVDFSDESSSSEGDIVAWSWDFDDGDSASVEDPSHSFDSESTYSVNLSVEDENGNEAFLVRDVEVSDSGASDSCDDPDLAAILEPSSYTVSPGDTVSFDGGDSEPSTCIDEYRFDFDYDGSFSPDHSGSSTTSTSYDSEGEYGVMLEVVDAESGNTDRSSVHTITVSSEEPRCDLVSERTVGFSGFSREYVQDNQASQLFDSASYPRVDPEDNVGGPSHFFGSDAVYSNRSSKDLFVDDGSKGPGNELSNYFVYPSGFGEGLLVSSSCSVEDWLVDEDPRGPGDKLVNPPHPDSTSGFNECGDSNHGWGGVFECPEDYGLPANQYDEGSGNSSTRSVTEAFNSILSGGNFDASSLTKMGRSGDDTDAPVEHNHDMEVVEHNTDFDENLRGQDSVSDEVFQYDSWDNGGNAYLSSSRNDDMRIVYPDYGLSDIGEVDNHHIESSTHSNYTSAGKVQTGCENMENATCEPTGDYEVTSRTLEDVDKYEYVDGSETWNVDSQRVWTEPSSGNYGYERKESEEGFTVEVDYYEDVNNVGTQVYDRDGTSQVYECDINETSGGTCDATKTEYYTPESVDINDSYSENTKQYYYEDVYLDDALLFSTHEASSTEITEDPRDVLFYNDPLNGTGYQRSDVNLLNDGGRSYYSYTIEPLFERMQQENHPAVTQSGFSFDVEGSEFESVRDYYQTYNVDGPQGLGDGYVALRHDVSNQGTGSESKSSNWNVVGFSDGLARHESGIDGSDLDFVDRDWVENRLQSDISGCEGDALFCVVSVDLKLKDFDSWTSISPESGIELQTSEDGPVSVNESLGACSMYNDLTGEYDLDSYENVQCKYEFSDGLSNHGEENLDTNYSQVAGKRWHTMQGPQVDEDFMQNPSSHGLSASDAETVMDDYEATVEKDQCVLHGRPVDEGTVAQVANPNISGYEAGGDSPDWEACLNIPNDEVSNPGSGSYHEFGGQWYDLDNPEINQYLRNNEAELGLDTGQRSGDPDHINYYYTENPNPQHSLYNPKGETRGVSLLADCGPLLEGCAEDPDVRGGLNSVDSTVFSFFDETFDGGRTREEDFSPQGRNVETDFDPFFDPAGYVNRIKSRSDQLSPGHYDYDIYSPEWFRDTRTGEDHAVQYALTKNLTWSVASTGVPYPPYGAAETSSYASDSLGNYYRENYTGRERSDTDSETVSKTVKAFGNSIAVVAQQDITDNAGNSIVDGEGYWIDPDDMRSEWENGNIQGMESLSNWRSLLQFKIDLTGPDAGIGYDLEEGSMSSSNEGYIDEFRGGGNTVFADIYWQGLYDGGMKDEFEPPVCGDDRYEFLLEEMGESTNSERWSGRYACANSPDYCVTYENDTKRLYSDGGGGSGFNYINTNEKREDTGRLKQDKEACGQRDEDPQPMWYDQDYGEINGEIVCNENTLFGEEGQRWIGYDYINSYPHAVTGGIDDSWNDRFEQTGHPSIESRPDSFPDDPLDNGVTPVDTGTNASVVADPTTGEYGFCGGDDASEYLIYQDSATRFLETDNSVIGVAADPDSCVLENSRLDNSDEERRLYEEGDRVSFEVGDGSQREISCFDGAWYGNWPVSFLEDNVTAELGETKYTSFSVINPEDSTREFELELSFSDSQLDTLTSFATTGDNEMNTTVPGGESRTFDLEIQANRELDEEVELVGESRRGDLEGYDQLQVEIVEGGTGNTSEQTREVPGLTAVQIIAAAAASAILFFFS